MMKKLLYLLLFSGSFQLAQAQTYRITPDDTLEVTVPIDNISTHDIYFENISGANLRLAWSKVEESFPAGWEYTLCDYGSCHTTIPSWDSMNVLLPGGTGFVGSIVTPHNIPGTGRLRVYVYDQNFPSSGDTILFIMHASAVGVADRSNVLGLEVFPNPASDEVLVKADAAADAYILLDAAGKQHLSGAVSVQTRIDVSLLPAGIYLLQVTDRAGNRSVSKLVIE